MYDFPIWFADTLRTLSVLLGGAAGAVSILIAVRYERAYRAARAAGSDWKGLLPRHVRNISVAHCAALGLLMYEVLLRLGGDITWRATLLILLSLTTLYALYDVARYRARKVKSITEVTVVEKNVQEDTS